MQQFILALIRLYQRTISPDHGVLDYGFMGCRFYPSCSVYTYSAINTYGLWAGLIKSLARLLRCNPFSDGGVDYPS